MKFLDPDDPFFRRPAVRWLSVLIPVGWSLVEFFWMGSPLFGVVFLGLGAYSAWMLFLRRRG
jgi:hypothetical protein